MVGPEAISAARSARSHALEDRDIKLPVGFVLASKLSRRRGSVYIGTRDRPACLWIVPLGYIGPMLLRADVAFAERFGHQHPEGWSYVADTTRVTLVNPLNIVWLRRISRLPHLVQYIVIAPRWIQFLGRLSTGLLRPTALVSTVAEALSLLDSR